MSKQVIVQKGKLSNKRKKRKKIYKKETIWKKDEQKSDWKIKSDIIKICCR